LRILQKKIRAPIGLFAIGHEKSGPNSTYGQVREANALKGNFIN
jgi:hypothetical protein